jgi:hypothetical protein
MKTKFEGDRPAFLPPALLPSQIGSASMSYRHRLRPDFAAALSGGITHAGYVSYTWSADLEKRLGDFHLKAGYQRYVSLLSDALLRPSGGLADIGQPGQIFLAATLFRTMYLQLKGRLSDRTSMNVEWQMTGTSVAVADRGRNDAMMRTGLNYKISPKIVAFLDFAFYARRQSALDGGPLNRTRFFGGLRLLLPGGGDLQESLGSDWDAATPRSGSRSAGEP